MRTLAIVELALLWVGWTSQVHAAAPSRESRARAAQRACLTGDPRRGVEILTDLYLDSDDPTHIFNQGRCFEMNRMYEDAIGRFREYMVKAKTLSEEERADTEKHIATCQSYLSGPKTEPSQTAAPQASKPKTPPGAPHIPTAASAPAPRINDASQTAPQTAVPTIQQASQTPARPPGAGLRTAGLVVGAVGAAGFITAVLLNLKVNSMSSDLEKPYNYSPTTDSTRKDYKTLGWVSYGLGGACLAGGALLYYFGWRKAAGPSLEPTVAPGVAGAAVAGTF